MLRYLILYYFTQQVNVLCDFTRIVYIIRNDTIYPETIRNYSLEQGSSANLYIAQEPEYTIRIPHVLGITRKTLTVEKITINTLMTKVLELINI